MNSTDTELRGIVLNVFYKRRDRQWIQLQEEDFAEVPASAAVTTDDIFRVCEQLKEKGYLEFKSVSHLGRIVAGRGTITGSGVDVLEHEESPQGFPIIYDHSVHTTITGSSHVQVGNGNIQGDMTIGSLVSAINGSTVSEEQKQEAKSLLQRVIDNPIVSAVLGEGTKTAIAAVLASHGVPPTP